MTYPPSVSITEVGPRDGLQSENQVLSTQEKIELITALSSAGLPSIQVTSFVHPRVVPQLADAEDLLAGLPPAETTTYTALTLNRKGVERAAGCGLRSVEVSVSASDAHSRRNAGMTSQEALDQAADMVALARRQGMDWIRGSIQCVFGCPIEGRIPIQRIAEMAARFKGYGLDCLVLADTAGIADPHQVRTTVARVLEATGDLPLGLHLHDTFGLGLVNLMAGLEMGISRFDTALGGMGGCPFVPGAAGNIATEDSVFLLERLGLATGVDIAGVAAWTARLQERFGKAFPGRVTDRLLKIFGGCAAKA